MREILFTGKREYNGEWVEGYYLYRGEEYSKIGTNVHYIVTHDLCGFSWYEVIPETVGQFTGLYDSTQWEELTTDEQALFLYPVLGGKRSKEDWKGRPIFEGYIVKVTYTSSDGETRTEKALVKYDETDCCFYPMRWNESCEWCDYSTEINSIEVIGNIHDNPELLEVANE